MFDLDRAIDLFKKALQAEPDSSLAHAYLSMAACGRAHFMSDDGFLKLGEVEAYEAIRLSPDSKEAHRALAGVFYQHGKFAQALEEGLRSVESSGPEERIACFIGMTLDILGRPDRALSWYSLARHLGGPPGDVDARIGDCWVKLCDDERALEAYRRAEELQSNRLQGEVGVCHLRLLQGDFDGARKLGQSSRWSHDGLDEAEQIAAQVEFFDRKFDVAERLYSELSRNDVNGGGSFYGAVTYQSALGRAEQAMGETTDSKTVLQRCLEIETIAVEREPENPEAAYRVAAVESSLGMREPSIHHLRMAVSLGWIDYRSFAMDPRFDAVREDPPVKAILKDLAFKVADMRVKSQSVTMEKWRNKK